MAMHDSATPLPSKSTKTEVIVDLSDDDVEIVPCKINSAKLFEVDDLADAIQQPFNSTLASIEQKSLDEDDDDDASSDGTITSDIIHAAQDPNFEADDSEACTEEECRTYRRRLRQVGLSAFVEETVSAGAISAKRLCTAFGMRLPALLKGEPDEAYYKILGKLLLHELQSRQKLPQYNTIEDAVTLLQKSKSILVITGAGISTNLGIPDFRSKTTGFYAQLREAGFDEPEDVFNIDMFDADPSIFFTFASETFPKGGVCSPTHTFIRLLQDQNKLLTNYTQNIDNLEEVAGISTDKLIQCHGSWASATCRKSKYHAKIDMFAPEIRNKQIPQCPSCTESMPPVRQPLKRKRSPDSNFRSNKNRRRSDGDSDEDDDIQEAGVMKPDITFFGEALPQAFFDRFRDHDYDTVDLVIVIGTSMQVAPVSEIPRALNAEIPQIYISKDPCPHINFDITLLGDCDIVVAELAKRVGWDLKHRMLAEDQKVAITPHEENVATWHIKAT